LAAALPGAAAPNAASAESEAPAFVETSKSTGLEFVHFNGMSGQLYTAEIMGAGVALLDFDNDGDLDVYLGQGGYLDDARGSELVFEPTVDELSDRLFRNDLEVAADGTRSLSFTDVTRQAGLAAATGYNMGVATGDFDGDGWTDIYATNLGSNHLLRNRGDGSFEEVTRQAGADDAGFSVPASFFDFDGDGLLDVFVGNYHRFRVSQSKQCFLPNPYRDYCGPLAYPAQPDRLLHNRGDGSFRDATTTAGLTISAATALGAVTADFDGDGLVDLYVANDGMANHLWLNQGDGTFVEDALLTGTAFDQNGQPQASMGVVADDLDGDGSVDLFMAHLVREYNTLYLNDGRGLFDDRSRGSGLADASWPMTGFGAAVLDYDGDGLVDLYVVNGGVHRIEEQMKKNDPHPLRIEEVPAARREQPVYREVSQGLAVGDLDNDGDTDLVVTNNAGPVRLLENTRRPAGGWLGVRLVADAGSDVLGARAAVLASAQPRPWRRVHTDGSYGSAGDPRLLFAPVSGVESDVRVSWPGGLVEDFRGVRTGAYSTLRRGEGVSATQQAGRRGDG
jgi:hypothetical protein